MSKKGAFYIYILGILLTTVSSYSEKEQSKALNFVLQSVDNEEIVLDSLIGDGPIYISFWAIWCRPCIKELDKINIIYEKYKAQGFRVLAINEDNPRSFNKIKPFVKARKWNFDVLLDRNQEVLMLYQIRVFPTAFILDINGNISFIHYGFKPGDEKHIEEEIQSLLKEKNKVRYCNASSLDGRG